MADDRLISLNAAFDALNRIKIDRGANWYVFYQKALTAVGNLPSARQWILCEERLPGDDEEVIVSCTDDSGDYDFDYTTVGWHYKGLWVVNNERSFLVRAWMPLPESYKEE